MLRLRPASSPRGFTLVELLVVIAINAMLVTLLLPAVQAARESARRAQCMNNLRNIGLAVQNFHSAQGKLPSSHRFETQPDSKNRSGRGWITMILPFMEEQPKYDLLEPFFDGHFGGNTGINAPEVAHIIATPISIFRCPSASTPDTSTKQYQWTGKDVAVTNYKGVIGNTKMGGQGVGTPDCHRGPDCRGLFWRFSYLRTIRFKNISDGLSKTFLAGEDLPRYNYHSALYYGNGDYSSTHFPLNVKPIPPNPADWPLSMTFRSDHPGGAYFALLDGTVAFINDGIDFDTYRYLSTRNGGELVTSFLD